MKAKLIKTSTDYYHLVVEKSNYYYGHTSPEFCELQNKDGSYTHKLSLKNCQAIERGYDLEQEMCKLVDKKAQQSNTIDLNAYEQGCLDAFQKALEILGDKKFSEEDIEKAIEFGHKTYHSWKDRNEEKFIQSLQQTEWEVDIEMEYVGECNGNNDEGCFQDSPGHNCGCFERRPKLDADGCLILKLKSE